MTSPDPWPNVLPALAVGYLVVVLFSGFGVLGLASSIIRVDEDKLVKWLVRPRQWFSVAETGLGPALLQRWVTRLGAAAFIGFSQLAVAVEMTGEDYRNHGDPVLVGAVVELLILAGWSVFVFWAFLRAYDPSGVLPTQARSKVTPTRYNLGGGSAWKEPSPDDVGVEKGHLPGETNGERRRRS